ATARLLPRQVRMGRSDFEGTGAVSPTVRDNPDENRYEIYVDGELAGFGDYKLSHGRIALIHTEIGVEFSGRGLARKLVADELADVRERGLAVLPFCPYVRQVI